MHNIKVVSLSFIKDPTEDYNLGDNDSVPKKLLQRDREKASLYMIHG